MQEQDAINSGMFWAVAVVLGIDLALLLHAGFHRHTHNRPVFAARWSLADIWFGAQYALVITLLLGMLLLVIVSNFLPHVQVNLEQFELSDPQTLLYFVLPITILQNVVFFAVPAGFIVLKYETRLLDIGLPPFPTARDWKVGLSIGILALLVGSGIGWGMDRLAETYRSIPWVEKALQFEQANPVAEIVRALPSLSYPGLVMAVLAIGIGAAIGEETFFRGFVFNALKLRFGLGPALFVSALLFTLPHTYSIGLVPVFLLGVLLAWLYNRTNSLWIPIIIHATNNTFQVVAAFFWPGLLGSG